MQNILYTIRKRRGQLIGLLLIVVIAFGAVLFIRSLGFHVSNTAPKLNNVSYLTPYIEVNFNKTLTTKDLSYSSQDDFVTNFEMEGKTLTLYIDNNMEVDKTYTITIKNIHDVEGHTIKNKVLTFKAQDIEFGKLPQKQQDYITDRNSKKEGNYTAASINYTGFDALKDQGLASDNLDLLEQAFFNYANGILQQRVFDVTLDNTTLVVTNHTSDSPDSLDHASFEVLVDDTRYKAQIDYSFIDSVFLRLYDMQGNQVFQSSDVT